MGKQSSEGGEDGGQLWELVQDAPSGATPVRSRGLPSPPLRPASRGAHNHLSCGCTRWSRKGKQEKTLGRRNAGLAGMGAGGGTRHRPRSSSISGDHEGQDDSLSLVPASPLVLDRSGENNHLPGSRGLSEFTRIKCLEQMLARVKAQNLSSKPL